MSPKNQSFNAAPVFLAFLCMGFGDVVGPLTGLIKQEFQLSNFMAQLIPFMGFLMFGLLSIPLGIVQAKAGRKSILLVGLSLALLGLGIPYINGFSAYGPLLLGILLLGAGAAFLQVSGNPLMRDVSPEGKYSRNLSLAQFIKAIGSLSGALIPLAAVNYWNSDWRVLFPVYAIVVGITLVWLVFTRITGKTDVSAVKVSFKSSFSLMTNPFVFFMVIGIFLYVGAEVSMSSGLPIFLQDSFALDIEKLGLLGTLFFFIALMSGRFLGAIILNWINAVLFLRITIVLAIIGFAGLFSGIQSVAMVSIFIIGLGFANIFPLIFSITVDKMPERSNELAGLMVTAIVGGAVIPPIVGYVADLTSSSVAFIVPLVCVFFIAFVAIFRTGNLKTT